MRCLSTRAHEVLQYLVGLLLLLSPWMFGYQHDTVAKGWSVALGLAIIVVAALTEVSFAVLPVIPFAAALGVDFAIGAFLMATPFSFRFHANSWAPLFAVGLWEIIASLITVMPDNFHGRSRGADPLKNERRGLPTSAL